MRERSVFPRRGPHFRRKVNGIRDNLAAPRGVTLDSIAYEPSTDSIFVAVKYDSIYCLA